MPIAGRTSHFVIEDSENLTELAASVYWKKDWLSLKGGANLYATKSGGYAAFRLAPTAYLPHEWQIGMQVIYYTKNTPRYEATGVPVYDCLSVNKLLGTRWNLGIDWHDMFDAFCSDALINRARFLSGNTCELLYLLEVGVLNIVGFIAACLLASSLLLTALIGVTTGLTCGTALLVHLG